MTDPTTVNESFGKLLAIESELSALFIEREEVVRAMLLALLSRGRLALIGPPGTAKSIAESEILKASSWSSVGPEVRRSIISR